MIKIFTVFLFLIFFFYSLFAIGQNNKQAAILFEKGMRNFEKGTYQEALSSFQQASSIYKEAKAEEKYLESEVYASKVKIYLGKFEEGINELKKLEPICLKVFGEKHAVVAELYTSLGDGYYYLQDWQKSEITYTKAFQITKGLYGEMHYETARAYSALGTLCGTQGDYLKSITYDEKAIAIILKIYGKNHEFLVLCYDGLAASYGNSGDYSKQVYYGKKGLEVADQTNVPALSEVAVLVRLSQGYQRLENYQEAEQYLKRALTVALKYEDACFESIGNIYSSLGETAYHVGKDQEALAYFQKGLDYEMKKWGEKSSKVSGSYGDFSRYYRYKKDYKKALYYENMSIKSLTFNFKGKSIYENPKPTDTYYPFYLFLSLTAKAIIFRESYHQTNDMKDLEATYQAFLLATDMIDELRKIFSLSTQENLYKNYFLVYEGFIEFSYLLYEKTKNVEYLHKAFEIAEKSKSVMLLASLRDVEAKISTNIPAKTLEEEKNLKAKWQESEKKYNDARLKKVEKDILLYQDSLFAAKTTYDSFIKDLEKNYPQYFNLKHNYQVSSAEEIQKTLQKGETLLEYVWGDRAVYVFKITSQEINLYEISEVDKLTASIEKFQKSFRDMNFVQNQAKAAFESYTKEAHFLYNKLLAPILTKDIEKLIIVPDGSLGYIPLEALIEQKNTSKQINYKNLSYLIKKYSFQYAYSGTLLLQTLKRNLTSASEKCLAFAPAYQNSKLTALRGGLKTLRNGYENLPGAQQEVKNLASFVNGDFYIGKEARKEVFQKEASKYSIIHLAMHGEVNLENPMNSKLVFSKEGNQDNNLYNYELYNMDLKTELVVLSACETGFGKFIRGEGIMSLARGFMQAGVSSVLTTLWKAEDKSSSQLMGYFYENLHQGTDKSMALRKAKESYLAQSDEINSHPFYWANFVLVGDAKPILTNYTKYYWLAALILLSTLIVILYWKRKNIL